MIRLAACVAAAAMLAACGLKGPLERPPPLWGAEREPGAEPPDPTMDTPTNTPLVFPGPEEDLFEEEGDEALASP
ncbi:MAG: lipoprotein [Caulobacterales bacterium]|nr:lipoprotein [Caulobacterales bacterium]